uniref:Uncharacterized protein n=1 Tax=Meloidogyne javanica TaxID=6303 RepID=A0A915LZ09_MELJA
MFNSNLEQQSIATIADAHAMQMANLILSTNQQNQLQQSPHSFYSSVPLNGCNNNTTTNTNSPSTADAPSIGDISGISLFTDNTSTLTLNSHLSNNSRIIKTENFEAPTASKYLETFKTIFTGQDTDIFNRSLKVLKLFFEAVNKKGLLMNSDLKDFREIISLLLKRLATARDDKASF